MSLGDFRVVDPGDGSVPVARKYQTKANNTAIQPGEFVVQGTGGDVEYVVAASDGAADSAVWVGVAASADSVTASADGVVWVYDNPDYLFRGKPTTAGNLASSIILTQVTLDVSDSVQTVDEDDVTNGTLLVQAYDSVAGTIDVKMAKSDHIGAG